MASELVLEDGGIGVAGSLDIGISSGQLAARVAPSVRRLTAIGPGLEEHAGLLPPSVTFANDDQAPVQWRRPETG